MIDSYQPVAKLKPISWQLIWQLLESHELHFLKMITAASFCILKTVFKWITMLQFQKVSNGLGFEILKLYFCQKHIIHFLLFISKILNAS